jgi:hypothetical protein
MAWSEKDRTASARIGLLISDLQRYGTGVAKGDLARVPQEHRS